MTQGGLEQSMQITLIGCGKMGLAMLKGWLKLEHIKRFNVIEPHPSEELQAFISGNDIIHHYRRVVTLYEQNGFLKNVEGKHFLFLAVKPQLMGDVLQGLMEARIMHTENAHPDCVCSIAAGVPVTFYETYFAQDTPVVRIMPNTPVSVGQGASVFCCNHHTSPQISEIVQTLLKPLGAVYALDDESLMHAVTALSGSGPAYVFALTEAMAQAAEKSGLPEDIAAKLARQTVIGAAHLMQADSDKSPQDLREAVTSPGGTTAAALKILLDEQQDGLMPLLEKALAAAKKRSQELSDFS